MSDEPIVAEPREGAPRSKGLQLALGLAFGIVFGFLLQKGGVAKYELLVGVLLLEDFTVVRVMLAAILVGMLGVFALARLGLAKLQPKPTRYAANVAGGLVFGVGFGLAGYCPGTTAAAAGQGNGDAVLVMVGMVVGSWLYAELSDRLGRTVEAKGDRGKLTFVDVTGRPQGTVVATAAAVLGAALLGAAALP